MDLQLEGARIFVSAGGSGIGRQIVGAFLEEGASVQYCDIDAASLDATAQALPDARGHHCDVADRATVQAVIETSAAEMGGLDVLVNNAGIAGPTGRLEEVDPEAWEHCITINLVGQYNCARAAIPFLRDSINASMINISSAAGKFGYPMRTAYAASKWGVVGLTKSLSMELGSAGIRVNAILPGIVAGDRQDAVLQSKADKLGVPFEELERAALGHTSLAQYVTAHDISDQILFLCSRRGAHVSGQAISVCGDLQSLY